MLKIEDSERLIVDLLWRIRAFNIWTEDLPDVNSDCLDLHPVADVLVFYGFPPEDISEINSDGICWNMWYELYNRVSSREGMVEYVRRVRKYGLSCD